MVLNPRFQTRRLEYALLRGEAEGTSWGWCLVLSLKDPPTRPQMVYKIWSSFLDRLGAKLWSSFLDHLFHLVVQFSGPPRSSFLDWDSVFRL